MGTRSTERGSAEDGTGPTPGKKPGRSKAASKRVDPMAHARAARSAGPDVARAKRSRRGQRRDVSTESLLVARSAGTLMDAWAPVRRCFVRRDAAGWDLLPEADLPPMAQMLKTRSGEVRLKLYLTVLWLAAAPPYAVRNKPAQAWARLFGLTEPDSLGSIRVRKAVDWLVQNNFLTATRGRGAAPTLGLKLERGGAEYTRPTGSKEIADRYLQVPQQVWSGGWISVLSGPAMAALLIIIDDVWGTDGVRKVPRVGRTGVEYQEAQSFPAMWLAESQLKARYGLSWDTWSQGVKELAAWGLVRETWASATVGFGSRHRRRVVRLNLRTLKKGVAEVAEVDLPLEDDEDEDEKVVLRNFD